MNAKISVFVICDEPIKFLLLYNFHDCTFKRVNQSCSIQKLASESMLNGALLIEMVNNSFFSESKKNFGRLIKQETF